MLRSALSFSFRYNWVHMNITGSKYKTDELKTKNHDVLSVEKLCYAFEALKSKISVARKRHILMIRH